MQAMGEACAVRILMDLIRRLDAADWNLPVYILSRLISADATLFRQFVQNGGLCRDFLQEVHSTNLPHYYRQLSLSFSRTPSQHRPPSL